MEPPKSSTKTHLYLMPGMAANPTIFEHISLPEDKYEIHWLQWELPKKGESLSEYAQRMTAHISHQRPVLLGVSFGGILVQEVSKHIEVEKLIIVSSIKTKYELPRRMKIAKNTMAYKLLPTSLVNNVETLAKYAFGETATKRMELYKKYLSVRDKAYLDWAIYQILHWDQEEPLPGIIHIHGQKDNVFPTSHLNDYIEVEKGTHIMIINKYKWFNKNLPKILEGQF